MGGPFTPDNWWRTRVTAVEEDVARMEYLAGRALRNGYRDAGARFRDGVDDLKRALSGARAQPGHPMAQRWFELDRLETKSKELAGLELELLGGMILAAGPEGDGQGLDGGFAAEAAWWLNDLRTRLRLDRPLSVIIGRGPTLDVARGIVRVPFLDWDLWHLPLLSQAIGLLAATDADLPEVPVPLGWRGSPSDRKNLAASLYADMLATAVAGPAYPLAVLALQLDFAEPDLRPVADHHAEDQAMPSSAERLAMLLATLDAMGREVPLEVWENPQFDKLLRLLRDDLWGRAGAGAAGQDALDAATSRLASWHAAVYRGFVRARAGTRIAEVRNLATQADACYGAWADRRNSPLPAVSWPASRADRLTLLAGALWLYCFNIPGRADAVLKNALYLLDSPRQPDRITYPPLEPLQALATLRIDRLARRMGRLVALLNHPLVAQQGDSAAVKGRFYRLLSERDYELELTRGKLGRPDLRREFWRDLAASEQEMAPIEQEAVEFLGAVLVHRRGLDREPPAASGETEGPSARDLADLLLGQCADQTGVSKQAGTVLGRDPFLNPATSVIRLRFPDWSVWNLPLMGHEFGHAAALTLPPFLHYRRETTSNKEMRGQMEELFADVLATYMLGPAFACSAILLQFSPAQACLPRGAHPSYHERTLVILNALDQMNEATRTQDSMPGDYREVIDTLRGTWSQAVEACGAAPQDESAYTGQLQNVQEWGKEFYAIDNTYYRLGAGYTPTRWKWAGAVAEQDPLDLSLATLQRMANAQEIAPLLLKDILNALWRARLKQSNSQGWVAPLRQPGLKLARDYCEGRSGDGRVL